MESDELRFKHVGLSSDGAVIFCEMDNGKTYSGGLTLINPHMLRVRGCLFAILCGGENWSRSELTAQDKTLPQSVACPRNNASR